MKKVGIYTKILVLLLGLFVIVLADWNETPCWYWIPDSGYRPQYQNPMAFGRKWLSASISRACNKDTFMLPYTDSLSLAQWLDFGIEATSFWWKVRKPGTYAMKGPIFCILSNYNVLITFAGFENLNNNQSVNPTIEKWFAFSDTTTYVPNPPPPKPPLNWMTPNELNNYSIVIMDNEWLHEIGYSRKIWEKVRIVNCNSAGEWHDPSGAYIIINLQYVPPWIDPATGEFRE